MDLCEQSLQFRLQCLVFSALIELAQKMAASANRIEREGQCGHAEILQYMSIAVMLNRIFEILPYCPRGL
jgi:hypothetical protein